MARILLVVLPLLAAISRASELGVRDDLHFPLHARGTNKDGSVPVYKNPHASIEARVNDLLPRMTIEEKVAQLYVYLHICAYETHSVTRIQGDMNGWMNFNDPLDDTKTFNQTGLVRYLNHVRVCNNSERFDS